MTAPEDTRPSTDNSGGVPTEVALIDYLQDVDRPVSLDRLAKATGATRDALKARLEQLEARGLIIVSMGLYHVTISLVDGAQPIADGGRAHPVADVDLVPEQIYTILSNERRRETLRVLARQAERDDDETTYAPVSPLAAVVCASDADFSPAGGPGEDDQHATYVALTQTHLPLLHDLGAVEYYSRVQKVAPTDVGLALAQLMDVVDGAAAEADE
ncbi:MarR family transcriptional regulator [Halorubrum ezzemoulense]|nr:MarR family transcriptional regulator [Halorubrum ezzemoulense]